MFFDSLNIGNTKLPDDASSINKNEIFALGSIGNLFGFYLPLLGRVCVCDDEFRKLMLRNPQCLEDNLLPTLDTAESKNFDEEPYNLALLLTSRCNLRCTYCYASAGENIKIMDFEYAKTALELMNKKSEHLQVVFHGGGEPTLEFKLMKKIWEHAKKLKDETTFYLQTNGVFSTDVRNWISKNIDFISISCDGPPYIQDVQRPLRGAGKSSPIVERNIRYLTDKAKEVGVSAVISKFSSTKQNEILGYFYRIGVKRVRFSPVCETGRCISCPTPYSNAPVLESAVGSQGRLLELADMYGISLSLSTPLDSYKEKGCGLSEKNLILTPDGFVSPCYIVTSADSDGRDLLFGNLDGRSKKIIIDDKKLDSLRKSSKRNITLCQKCLMKSNCFGGCLGLPPSRLLCDWTQRLSREIMLYKLQKNLIRIKPFLEEGPSGLIYRGIFNTLQLTKFPGAEPDGAVVLQIDVTKIDFATLTKEIMNMNPKLLIVSFKLSSKDVSIKLGKKIEKFLRALNSRRIPLIITKPLPKCIFGQKYEEIVKEFRIPRNCEECLELFILNGNSFSVCNTGKKIAQNRIKNRKQIYEVFSKYNKRVWNPSCSRCVYTLRQQCNGMCP